MKSRKEKGEKRKKSTKTEVQMAQLRVERKIVQRTFPLKPSKILSCRTGEYSEIYQLYCATITQERNWAGGWRGRGPEKTQPQTRRQMQRRPVARPLGGAEVLVAVRGPSPGEGGGNKIVNIFPRCARGLYHLMEKGGVEKLFNLTFNKMGAM